MNPQTAAIAAAPAAFMLMGAVGAGKTTLFNLLYGREENARKTQALEFENSGIDTPGEFFSHPRLYHALINTSSDVDILVYVHSCDNDECRLPPGLLNVYGDKRLVGVITKTDLPGCDPGRAESVLRGAGGFDPIFRVSNRYPDSIAPLKRYLLGGGSTEEGAGLS
ncbi:MAG: ethanolamine utilization protein EutP [Candidatus Accumulibacter sp.]|jgi:ethanolamine utilization protein EutP|nr:ethanolamine utilization protein EutP [Accumulibacter sp.]